VPFVQSVVATFSLVFGCLKYWHRIPLPICPRRVPEPDHSFDRFVSTYVLDLLAPDFIERLLSEAHRVLVPGGKLCLVSMTFGASPLSRAVCWGWHRLWRLSPGIVGGCHPIELLEYLPSGAWKPNHQTKVTSWGVTSEVLVASAK